MAFAVWLAVNLPVMLKAPDGWAYFYTFSRSRGESWGSLWLALSDMGHHVPDADLNRVVSIALLALFAGIAWIALRAPRRPRLAQLAFLTVAAFLLVNKVYSPQYVLWLVFLFPLARPRWRDFVVWIAFETIYFIAIWWQLEGLQRPDLSIPSWPHTTATLLRIAALLWVCGSDHQGHLSPGVRPGASSGPSDDPAGGIFDDGPGPSSCRTSRRLPERAAVG